MTKPVWYCTSSRSHTTVAKYAEYQAGTLEEACIGDENGRSYNSKIKFGDGSTRYIYVLSVNLTSTAYIRTKSRIQLVSIKMIPLLISFEIKMFFSSSGG